jgi:hypothetical protein
MSKLVSFIFILYKGFFFTQANLWRFIPNYQCFKNGTGHQPDKVIRSLIYVLNCGGRDH